MNLTLKLSHEGMLWPNMATYTLQALKERTNVTDEQLDSRLEESKLWELAGHLGNFEEYVGLPGFNLNKADIADLKDCASANGHQYAMKKAFEKWLDVSYDKVITYRVLVEILIELRKRTVAEAVCRSGEFNYYG